MRQPNILFIMCDQLRADAIAAYGNPVVRTPNLDRLAERGITFTKAYSSCPVCLPARYMIRTGCEPYHTGTYYNGFPVDAFGVTVAGDSWNLEERCGPYLPRTLKESGYRTFGIGKFHTHPWNEDLGYDVQMYSEELYTDTEMRAQDHYAQFIARNHPEFSFLEQLHGERTDMYYMPQMSPLPAQLTVESWAADRAIEQIQRLDDDRPYFGFVSFVGPHPPLAPPIPYNRMYNPDHMPSPVYGDPEVDHLDEHIPWMNYAIWADDISDSGARSLRARYYGEISYIDDCIGRILDAVEARGDSDHTLICFFSDHGDHLGDHRAWQKESFFESSCRIPFLLSWPERLPANTTMEALVGLTDLFGIATTAAGRPELRDGIDVFGMMDGNCQPRPYLFGYYGIPGTPQFKIMVRDPEWKYIFMANGGREQLFHIASDPDELVQRTVRDPETLHMLQAVTLNQIRSCKALNNALNDGGFNIFPYKGRKKERIKQFDLSKGITDFKY